MSLLGSPLNFDQIQSQISVEIALIAFGLSSFPEIFDGVGIV